LLLSGIGPSQTLSRFDIPIVADLPGVGSNLQDHLAVRIRYETETAIPIGDTSNVAEAGLFAYSAIGQGDRAPELQFIFTPALSADKAAEGIAGGMQFTCTVTRPLSRGYLTLRSNSPVDPPLINPDYLAEPTDTAMMVEGMHIMRVIAAAKTFDTIRGREVMPGPDVQSKVELERYLRHTASTLWHPVGTCKMGQDSLAVIDAQLRVHGIEALRVADASIMPAITSGNTNAPTIMIGEKAADLIGGSGGHDREGLRRP
jgi:choline dehydrogenase